MVMPTISDVHIDKPLGNVSIKTSQIKRNRLESVPIFKVGSWKGYNYKIEDLDEIVKNTNALIKEKLHEPPVKLGHREDQKKLLEESGLPAFGYVERLYRIGDQIFADIIDVPDEVMDWVARRLYDKVSSEIYLEYEHPETKENIGKVLRAVAFLGADIPAVKGLGSIMFHKENKSKIKIISFEDKNLEEAKSMNIWTIDEIAKIMPCCIEKVKKYMEEKGKKEIDDDELSKILALSRFEEVKKGEGEGEKIECPDGYRWDESLGKCVRTDEKQEDRIVCPKGYKWDEEQKRCVPIEVKEEIGEQKEQIKSEVKENQDKIEGDIIKDLVNVVLESYGLKVEELTPAVLKMIKEDLKGIEYEPDFDFEDEKINEEMMRNIEKLQGVEKESEEGIEKFQLPGGKPRGWTKESFRKAYESLGGSFEDCVEGVKGKVDSPERFCAWLKYRATGKWPGSKAWREDSEKVIVHSEENDKVKELKEKIKKYEKEIFKNEVKKIIEENRNVLLPKFDEYIEVFCENLGDKLVKFEDKEVDLRKLFIKFLNDIISSKIVLFGEIAKQNDDLEIKEEEKVKVLEKYSEFNKKVDNIELGLLAEKIAEKENIPYRDALSKAYKILKNTEVK